uniref:Uncharacterized protein n=1 Tax=Timema cristinae TaxID=61476 RepID=A0A7R9CR53_TIMCR|nr:unnamed protein product [Timema cristinae]
MASHGRFHYLLFVTCGLCMMTVIMEMLDIGYLLPAAHCDLGLTTKDKGTLNAMVFAGLAWVIIPQPWRVELPWCTYSSWRIFLVVCSIPGLITAILLGVFLPESPRFLYSQGRYDETLAVLRRIFSINTSCPPQQYPGQMRDRRLFSKLETGSGQLSGSERFPTIFARVSEEGKERFVTSALHYVVTADLHPGEHGLGWLQLFLYPDRADKTRALPMLVRVGEGGRVNSGNIIAFCDSASDVNAFGNGLILWMPDLFSQLYVDYALHPVDQRTICQVVEHGLIASNQTSNTGFGETIDSIILLALDLVQRHPQGVFHLLAMDNFCLIPFLELVDGTGCR